MWLILLMSIALIGTFFAISTGNYFNKKISIEIGQIATQDIYAPFQIENETATERKRVLAEQTVKPIYMIDQTIAEKAIENVNLLFSYIEAIKSTQITQQFDVNSVSLLKDKSPIALYEDEYKSLIQTNLADLKILQTECVTLLESIFSDGIHEEENKSLDIRNALEQTSLSAANQKIVYEIISSQIKTNIVVDEDATQKAMQAARQEVEPILVLQGEKIIGQGNRVTEEIYLLLDKIAYINKEEEHQYTQYVGIGIFILLIVLLIIKEVTHYKITDANQLKQIYLILILYILSVGMIRTMLGINFIYLPLAVMPMLVAILIRKDIAVLLQIILVSLSALIHKGDILFILYLLLTGILTLLIIENMQQRKHTMRSAIIVGTLHLTIYTALKLLVGLPFSTNLAIEGVKTFFIGVLAVVLVVGSLPLWEALFGFITPIQLLELTNPNQPVLKRLLLEATGTYYHSLLVANLAEAAADEIGANPLMTRVGGYYHDIGKLTCSNYFKENQVLDNPHDYLEPKASANVILSHVTSGIEIADAYKLPKCIKDMIMQHHGTSTMQYFYLKAKNSGEDVKEEDFRYDGPKPQTKEAGLIMLADIVEATVRSMQSKIGKECTVEDIVRKMVKQKLTEGQLDECPIYISDIEKIIHSFTKMLKGMYHERIEYPDRKDK